MSFDKTRSEERRRGNRRAITTANAPSTLPRPPPLIPPPPPPPHTLPSQIHLGHNLAADIDTLARVGVTLPRNYKTQAKTPPSDPPPVPKCVFRLRFDSEIQLRVGMEAKPLLLSLPPPPPPLLQIMVPPSFSRPTRRTSIATAIISLCDACAQDVQMVPIGRARVDKRRKGR